MISCRIRLIAFFFLQSCAYISAAASVSSVDTSTLKSLGLSRREIKEARSQEALEDGEEVYVEEEVDEEEEPWKTNEDWWKDPLAMFSDDEQEEEIDESVGIIEEAESLGEDISVDAAVEKEEEETLEELEVPEDDYQAPPAPVKQVSPKVATPESPTTTMEKPAVSKKKTLKKTRPAKTTADADTKEVATAKSSSSSAFASPLALAGTICSQNSKRSQSCFWRLESSSSGVSSGICCHCKGLYRHCQEEAK